MKQSKLLPKLQRTAAIAGIIAVIFLVSGLALHYGPDGRQGHLYLNVAVWFVFGMSFVVTVFNLFIAVAIRSKFKDRE